jgi:hypothetical protein
MKFILDRRQAASEVFIGFLMKNNQRVSGLETLPYARGRVLHAAPGVVIGSC